ncbi:MAG: NAD(+) synthase [Spirochaetales bacterium]|nr:NAD(+) synthase [Spirochaetales bacterium]
MTHGFFRVAAATPSCTVGDCGANTAEILSLVKSANGQGASLVVFPELSITGYTCADLFSQDLVSRVSLAAVRLIAEKTREIPITIVVGFPFAWGSSRYNCAAVISDGRVSGIVPKTHIPNYGEFYELRNFAPAPAETTLIPAGIFGTEAVPFGSKLIFSDEKNPDLALAVELCEDLWVPEAPSSSHAKQGALIIANLSASDEIIGKAAYRRSLVNVQSAKAVCAYIYSDAGAGESTQDLVFSGHNLISEHGVLLAEALPFSEKMIVADIDIRRLLHERRRMNTFSSDTMATNYTEISICLDRDCETDTADQMLLRPLSAHPFVPSDSQELSIRCEEVLEIQTRGLVKRLSHTGLGKAVIGLSGGLDSTLALLVTVRAFDRLSLDRTGILAITMPGFGTTSRTKGNATRLADLLGVSLETISIDKAVRQHFKDIGQDPEKLDITYENAQARERTQILMDKANMIGALVIGTGDLSELALGWATYNGDHMSMYAVNSSIPKTLVRFLVSRSAQGAERFIQDQAKQKSFSRILESILDTPVSPELLPDTNGTIAQETEKIVGPYELHDFFLYHLVRWGSSPARILYMAEKAFSPARKTAGDTMDTASYTRKEILSWMGVFYRRFFSQQFKRSCLPDGPKVGSVSLSPRGDWRMPSDASAAIWKKELESLE